MNEPCFWREANFLWGVAIPLAVVIAVWIAGIIYVCFKPSLWPELFGPNEQK
jgi:hypothetical protein